MERVPLEETPLPARHRAAVRAFLDAADAQAGDHVLHVILYGSAARGDLTDGSDVDLLVVWTGSLWEGLEVLVGISTRVLLETGVDLEVQAVTPDDLRRIEELGTAFFERMEREGLVVDR